MTALFNLFLDICLFRKGPQDVPASTALLWLCLIGYGLSGLAVLLAGSKPASALLETVVDILLLAGLCYGLLNLAHHRARFVPTLTALAGTGALLTVAAFPLVIWIDQESARQEPGALSVLLFFGLVGWSLAVTAHVLRHALSVSRTLGMLYATGYFVISIVVRDLLFSGA